MINECEGRDSGEVAAVKQRSQSVDLEVIMLNCANFSSALLKKDYNHHEDNKRFVELDWRKTKSKNELTLRFSIRIWGQFFLPKEATSHTKMN